MVQVRLTYDVLALRVLTGYTDSVQAMHALGLWLIHVRHCAAQVSVSSVGYSSTRESPGTEWQPL
jgi:hypothetical protein